MVYDPHTCLISAKRWLAAVLLFSHSKKHVGNHDVAIGVCTEDTEEVDCTAHTLSTSVPLCVGRCILGPAASSPPAPREARAPMPMESANLT